MKRDCMIRAEGGGAGNRLTTAAVVALRAAEDDKSRPSFEINAYNGGAIKPSWIYGGSVVLDLAGLRAVEPIAILLDHDDRQIVGQSTAVEITAAGINVSGIITGDAANPADPAGKVALHARNGFIWKASIGVMPERIEKIAAGADVTVNGKTHAGPLHVIRAGTLDEVSFLSIGADKSAAAKVAAAAGKANQMLEFHEWIKARGFDPATLDDTQRDALLKAYKAEEAADAAIKAKGGPDDLAAVLAPVRQKQARREAVRATVATFLELHPQRGDFVEAIGRQALAEDWSNERLELQYFRELGSNPINNAPRIGGNGKGATEEYALCVEAALARSGGLSNLEAHYDDKTLTAVDRDKDLKNGLSIKQALHIAASANGYSGSPMRDIDEDVLRAAFRRRGDDGIRGAAGPSTFDISGILSNVMNKFIVDYFMGVEAVWQRIAGRRSVRDFKQHSYYSLTGDMQYEEVMPGGELKHGKLGEQAYTLQAKTYGKIFQIDRRDLINDDLGAFTQVARRLGRGGALKLNEVFWKLFLDNAAFFSVGNGNFFAGANTALGVSSLETAEANFMKLTDPDGKPLAVLPQTLLVPPELKRTALALMNSTEVRDNTASVKYGTSNTFNNEFGVVTSVYLSTPTTWTGSSAKKWYLLASPNDIPVILVGFLNGNERPTIENAMADFDTLGIKLRGYWDWGVSLHEPRGGIAMKGEI